MIEGMGVGPAGSLLGAVSVALVPMPILFYYYGARLRERSAFAPTSVKSSAYFHTCQLAEITQIFFSKPRQPRCGKQPGRP